MRVPSWSLIIFVSTSYVIYGQRVNVQDDCDSRETCTACIRNSNCAWCDVVVDENTTKLPAQCVNQEQAKLWDSKQWCSPGTPENRRMDAEIVKDEALSSSNNIKQVQIRPQSVRMQLRQGDEHRLNVQYRQAEDYPVDLYFIVDLSFSMEKFRNDLSKLGNRIAKAMKSLTSNFRLGFGGFIDKNIRPMLYDAPEWDGTYHYSFKNQMPLTDDYEQFEARVRRAPLTGNYDHIEGGLDGVMQAIVCTKEIKWRSDARHLLVYVSDDGPHIAGDGRMAGLPQPNDEKCHLNATGFYSHAEQQDYPSLGQINWQARKNNINIIFATVTNFENIYDAVQSTIQGSAVGVFDATSENVIKLISGQYEKLTKTLTMTSNATADFLDVKFFSRCLAKGEALRERAKCDGIRVDVTVDFDVAIKLLRCPEREEDWEQIIKIKPEGINEGVIVELELICGCECSKRSNKTTTAPRARECHDHGILDCGVCSCDRGYFGKWCQCEGDQASANTDVLEASCRSENSSENCSGRGKCKCGSCDCERRANSEEKYYGKFCQCDNSLCGRSTDMKLCSGRGRCECGVCVCNSGWGGPACDCREDNSMCFPPGDNAKKCSDAGECVCGRCICNKETKRNGRFCEDCPSCPSQRCDDFKDCIECRVHKSGKIYEGDNDCNQCPDNIQVVDEIEKNQDEMNSEGHICRIAGDDGSTFEFTYVYSDEKDNKVSTFFARKEKRFRPLNDLVAATLGAILLTLLLGLLILVIWKVSTHLHDKREFQKFENERKQANWGQGQNPLYKTAVTTFKNPTHECVLQEDTS